MRVEKQKIGDLTKCYCVAPLQYRGKRRYLVASEKQFPCLLFDGQGNQVDQVWDQPGGTMSMVWLPGTDGAFLATHRFFSPNDSKEASIVLVQPRDEGWRVRTLCRLPHVHRFDILERGGVKYLLACTLCSGRDYKDDWSYPGKTYACVLPDDLTDREDELHLEVLREGMLKNHGYCRLPGGQSGLVTSEEGVFVFEAPEHPGGEWTITQLIDDPTSDAVWLDLDGDGRRELVTISPFHGDHIFVYREEQGSYRKIYTYGDEFLFGHAICAANILGRPSVVLGARNGARPLLCLRYAGPGAGDYATELLDSGAGSANVMFDCIDGTDTLLSANRETDEIAFYRLYPDA